MKNKEALGFGVMKLPSKSTRKDERANEEGSGFKILTLKKKMREDMFISIAIRPSFFFF